MKNTQRRNVRNGTPEPNRPPRRDRRVQKTKTSLHEALITLAREKPYQSIAVKDVIGRANVGRSTLYMHFDGKDDLLESGILEMVHLVATPASRGGVDDILAFSLPTFE